MPLLHVSVYSLLCPLNHVLYLVSDDDCSDVEQREAEHLDKREVPMTILYIYRSVLAYVLVA